ncbi:hypothetical protein [Streptosporangium pseudovulgare]|uniref:Uncharacterized protein n=1 Tax=Streptosporangium pseudovulgare TaxID=35765 RepID=A0ABQ2RHY0_9ACTN|nr:hypothetical protein [Streptosporangium pseudovulgare]GGQ28849.1 hypothetical protein GCM10010140_68750 [Streptosporangium pseudovulgare]
MPDEPGLIHEGWIREENARVFCEILASLIGYEFDDLDWQAIRTALPDTDDEQAERWYDHPLIGAMARLDVRLAQAVGGTVISVEVFGVRKDDLLHAQVKLACDLAAAYVIRSGHHTE